MIINNEQKERLVNLLQEINCDEKAFIKIYFLNSRNYTIKFIDEHGKKFHTIRVANSQKAKSIDCDWREKYGKPQN